MNTGNYLKERSEKTRELLAEHGQDTQGIELDKISQRSLVMSNIDLLEILASECKTRAPSRYIEVKNLVHSRTINYNSELAIKLLDIVEGEYNPYSTQFLGPAADWGFCVMTTSSVISWIGKCIDYLHRED